MHRIPIMETLKWIMSIAVAQMRCNACVQACYAQDVAAAIVRYKGIT